MNFSCVFLMVLLILPALEAPNGKSKNHNKSSNDNSAKTVSKISRAMDKGFEAIKKVIDAVFDEIPKVFERYFSFTRYKPPKDEDPEIKELRDKIAENADKLTKINQKEDTADNMDGAKVIYRENINIIHKLAKKLNNTRIDRWEKLYEEELTNLEFLSNKNLQYFSDFLQDLIQIENQKPLSKDEAERMKRVTNLRDDLYQIWNVLKIYENQTETNSQNVKKQADRAIRKFQKLAKEMNREGVLTSNAYLQLNHRAGQERQDLKSIVFDVSKVLNEFETDPDPTIVITASAILKLMKLYLLTFLFIDYLGGKNKEAKMEKANELLHYSKKMIPLIFREIYRAVPDERRLANIIESVKSSHDIMSSSQDMSFYIKKIKEYYDEIYWNGANHLNEAVKKRKKEEDLRSGRTDYNHLSAARHNLINLIYSFNITREVEANGRKVVNKAVSAIRNLERKVHINTMGIYVNRIKTVVNEGSIDADKLSRVLGIVATAENQASAHFGERPIDFNVLKLKEMSSEVLPWLSVLPFFVPELTKNIAPIIVRPVHEIVWKIADHRMVNGFDDLEEEVDDIKSKINDHEGKPKKLELDFMKLKATIEKFIRRNIGLM